MNLRDEINSAPRGTKAQLVRKTGLNPLTIVRATAGTQCGSASAVAIAEAFGVPDRWPELVVIRRRPAHQEGPLEGVDNPASLPPTDVLSTSPLTAGSPVPLAEAV